MSSRASESEGRDLLALFPAFLGARTVDPDTRSVRSLARDDKGSSSLRSFAFRRMTTLQRRIYEHLNGRHGCPIEKCAFL
jgi:hypothetical protein